MGIIGLGNIGGQVARIGLAFGTFAFLNRSSPATSAMGRVPAPPLCTRYLLLYHKETSSERADPPDEFTCAFPRSTILAMFDLIDPKPRGFSGRPLIALLFAAGLGAAAYPLGLRLHLDDAAVFVILSTVTFVVRYAWEYLDTRCG